MQYVVDVLREHGYEAVAPSISEYWGINMSEKYGIASTWSDKHVAYSGVGTFSLTDAVITEYGSAIRIDLLYQISR